MKHRADVEHQRKPSDARERHVAQLGEVVIVVDPAIAVAVEQFGGAVRAHVLLVTEGELEALFANNQVDDQGLLADELTGEPAGPDTEGIHVSSTEENLPVQGGRYPTF